MRIRYRAGLLDTAGHPAHAATSIRDRVILLDPDLKRHPREHNRILLHELFHFVWVRLGNPRRAAWERVLAGELAARVRGEAGWSAEWRKRELTPADVAGRSRRWREYCCESFCDTAAWVYGGGENEVALARGRLRVRKAWFQGRTAGAEFPI